VLFVACSCFDVSYAQQESQESDPAAEISIEEQTMEKDISEYTDAELVDLYLNDPMNLPAMDDVTLFRISKLAHKQDQQ
jgi:hypothetical protein